MSNLKNQQKKLLTHEIAGKIMEYFMGLNEKNESVIRRIAEKSTKKLVNTYFDAIKSQHKKALKAARKKEESEINCGCASCSCTANTFNRILNKK